MLRENIVKLKKIIKYVDSQRVKKNSNENTLLRNVGGTKIMGMSASQMRYCMISGKKSDVEFQGQQINQQRTTLATQSSAYNSQLLNMQVPTPPSSSDYTKTTYKFNKDGENCSISSAQYQAAAYTDGARTYPAGTYIVNFTTDTTADVGKTSGSKNVTMVGSNYRIGSGDAANDLVLVDLSNYETDEAQAEDFANILTIAQDCNLTVNGNAINTTADLVANGTGAFYKYTGSVDGKVVTKYVLASDVSDMDDGDTEPVSQYYVDQGADKKESEQLYGAAITWSDTGRMSSVTTSDAAGNEVTYSLEVESTKDEDAYNDAFNEYEYQKDQYANQMEVINAKMDIIQSQDKKLELKLQDLDTQQKALSTEMDSVKKVIDKNIESSFKSFG